MSAFNIDARQANRAKWVIPGEAIQEVQAFEADTLRDFDYHIESVTREGERTWSVRVECAVVRETVGWLADRT